nr:MAG TPA: hypothetical protein [Caudoviricetes sp.]
MKWNSWTSPRERTHHGIRTMAWYLWPTPANLD